MPEIMAEVRAGDPTARAFYAYDLELLRDRARRFVAAFAGLRPLVAYALKANAHESVLTVLRDEGLGGEAGSLGELRRVSAAGFAPEMRILNGNGRTPEEAAWVAEHGVHSVNADSIEELDLLAEAAASAGRELRVSLRVNPGIETPGHRYIATGDHDAKFGVAPDEALAAWASASARWPSLRIDGLHLHVGSQVVDTAPLFAALEIALELRSEAGRRGASIGLFNLGGGFGIDYERGEDVFPLAAYGAALSERLAGSGVEVVLEPGRWMVGPVGLLVAEVLWVKRRGARRFVVLAAGMNDLIRPALYQARHRIVPVALRGAASGSESEPACVVGPVCESADVFGEYDSLGGVERGDWVAIFDAGAYGAAMASEYNGRGRLGEVPMGAPHDVGQIR